MIKRGISILCCSIIFGCGIAYEPSLQQAERLQRADTLLRSVPKGMQLDIQARLVKLNQQSSGNEWEHFCVNYLLYQLQRLLATPQK